jgi:hypothetical protein
MQGRKRITKQMSLDDVFVANSSGVSLVKRPTRKRWRGQYAASDFQCAGDRACDDVSGLGAAASGIAGPASTSESMIRLIRHCAALESYYASPQPPETARDALSQPVTAVLHRVAHNA